jgi:hypothetical protein
MLFGPGHRLAEIQHTIRTLGAKNHGFHACSRRLLLIEGIQLPRTGTYSISTRKVKSACGKVFPRA